MKNEHEYGSIEHERSNDNQGKRPDQLETSAKIFFGANVVLIGAVIIHWLFS